MLSLLDDITNFFMAMLSPYANIPDSTFLILGVAAVLAIISNLANRFLVDIEKVRSQVAEVKAWQKEFDRARKSGDKQLLAKAQKRQSAIMGVQSRMMWDRMKVTLIFFIPFILVWRILAQFYSPIGHVAQTPFTVPYLLEGPLSPTGGFLVSYFTWYFLCSLTISLPLSRLLGTNPEQE